MNEYVLSILYKEDYIFLSLLFMGYYFYLFKPKFNKFFIIASYAINLLVYPIIVNLLPNYFWIYEIYIFSNILAFSLICFKEKWSWIVLSHTLIFFSEHVSLTIVYTSYSLLNNTPIIRIISNHELSTFLNMLVILIYTGIVIGLSILWKKPYMQNLKENTTYLNYGIVIGISFYLLLAGLNYYCLYSDPAKTTSISGYILMVLIFFIGSITYTLISINIYAKNHLLQLEFNVLEKQLQNQLNHYKDSQRYIERNRRFWHDSRNHILVLQMLLTQQKTEEALLYMEEISTTLNRLIHNKLTDHKIIDALLLSKKHLCKDNNIILSLCIDIPETLIIEDIHLCAIFSNILDNAIEGCLKLPSKQWIEFRLELQGDYLYFSCSNTFNANLNISATNDLLTTKEKTTSHGIGLKSIYYMLNRYQGTAKYEVNEDIFTLSGYLLNQPPLS